MDVPLSTWRPLRARRQRSSFSLRPARSHPIPRTGKCRSAVRSQRDPYMQDHSAGLTEAAARKSGDAQHTCPHSLTNVTLFRMSLHRDQKTLNQSRRLLQTPCSTVIHVSGVLTQPSLITPLPLFSSPPHTPSTKKRINDHVIQMGPHTIRRSKALWVLKDC